MARIRLATLDDLQVPGATAIDAATGDPLPVVSSAEWRIPTDPTMAPYSAVGDGVADDSGALRQALADGANQDREVSLPAGVFSVSTIHDLLPTGRAFRIRGVPGQTFIAQRSDTRILDFTGGTLTRVGALTADAAAGGSTLTLDAVGALAPGSKILIKSTRKWPGNDNTHPIYSETARVKSVAASVVTVYRQFEENWWVGDSAEVWLIDPLKGVEIHDVTFLSLAPGTRTAGAVKLRLCQLPVIRGCKFVGLDGPGVQIEDCWGFDVDVECEDLTDDPHNHRFGYGINCAGFSCAGNVRVRARNTRHAFTTNGSSVTGIPRHIRVTGQVSENHNSAFDCHCAGSDILFHDIQVFDSGQAISIRSLNVTVQGLTVVRSTIGITISDVTGVPNMGTMIDGLVARDMSAEVVRVKGHGVWLRDIHGEDTAGPPVYIDTGTRRVSIDGLAAIRPGASRNTSTTLTSDATYGDATVNVASAALFTGAGTAVLPDGATVTWTGKTATTLTGCTWAGGSGTYAAGSGLKQYMRVGVWCQGSSPVQDVTVSPTISGAQTLPAASLLVSSIAGMKSRGTVRVTNTAGAIIELGYQSLGALSTRPFGSDLVDLSAASIAADTSGWPASGSLTATITDPDTGVQSAQTITYTSLDADSFEGCTGGSGTWDPDTVVFTSASAGVLGGVQGASDAHGTLADGSTVTQPRIPCHWQDVYVEDAQRIAYMTGSDNSRAIIDRWRTANPTVTLDDVITTCPWTLREIRRAVTVDFGSIATGSTTSVAVTITGARQGDVATFALDLPGGIYTVGHLHDAYVTGDDTVRLTIRNQSGATVDLPSATANVIVTASPARCS